MRSRPLYHITHVDNVGKIIGRGLLSEYGILQPKVWLCDKTRLAWARKHVAQTHHWRVGDLRIFALHLGASWRAKHLRRRRRGIYYTTEDIIIGEAEFRAFTYNQIVYRKLDRRSP